MENLMHLVKISVIVSCVVLSLVLLKPVLNRRYHAKWKYYVWLCLALALLLPLSPMGEWLSETTEERAPIQITIPDIDRRFEAMEGTVTAPAVPVVPAAPAGNGGVGTVQVSPQKAEQTGNVAPRRSAEEWAVLIWIMGMTAFAAYYAVGTAVFYRRSLRWSTAAEEDVAAQVAALRQEMGIRRAIPVRRSAVVTSPMMIGFLRPKLLLSEGDFSRQELEFILRHELTHYKRRDIWYKLALLCANCVHWFNPFAYLLVREAAIDMELTCDDAVVAGGDAAVRRAYSETLLASLHRQSGVNAALSTFFYGGKETMKERFRNIMGVGRRRRGVVALLLVLAVTIAAACLIGCQVAGNEEKKEASGTALTAEELAQWQEKLNSVEWNGFVTHMYSEAKYIQPGQLLYLGAGIGHTPGEDEVQAYLAEDGIDELYTDLEAIAAPALADYLQEKVGLGLEEFEAPLGWTYVEEYDSYYFQHGDTNFAAVEVLSGMEKDGVITLELADQSGATTGGTLTIADGKVVSYTNALYSGVEAMVQLYLQDFATPARESAESRRWVDYLWLGGAIPGVEGDYYFAHFVLAAAYDEIAEEDWALAEWAVDGVLRYDGGVLVRMEEDGTVTQMEGHYGEQAMWQYLYMDLTGEEYVRYIYDYQLEGCARQQGWPAHRGNLIYSIHAGTNEWTQSAEEVARGWCLSWDDEMKDYQVLETWRSGSERADTDVLARVTTKGGRSVLLLLSQVVTDFHGVRYWEVLGHRLESGDALPAQRVGEDTRSENPTLTMTIEGMEERVPVYLYSGGGDYGIHEWSLYIPYDGWSFNHLTYRWCPDPEDMALSLQVLEHGGNYSFGRFYQSYRDQFDQVWTNEDQTSDYTANIASANVAHALGYQETAGGRYTESLLYKGEGKFYEVMWTYSAEQAEGWGTRLGWTAATFGIIGDNTPYETGELHSVTDNGPNGYLQEEDTADRLAGNYLVMPKTAKAFRLEQYVGVEKGVVDFTGIYTFLDADGSGILVYSARVNGEDIYLGVAHDSKMVTKTVVVEKDEIEAPDNRILGGMIRGMLEGAKDEMPLIVRNTVGTPWVSTGEYLVLPEKNGAFRLSGYFESYAEGLRAERRQVAPEDGYGDIFYDGFEWVYTYPGENGKELMVFLVDWSIAIEEEKTTSLAGGMYVENGRWYWGYPVYLIVEHNGEYVTRTFVMMENDCYPGDETFTNDLNNRLAAGVTTHTTHPSIYYDSATGKLFAIHSSPNQSA